MVEVVVADDVVDEATRMLHAAEERNAEAEERVRAAERLACAARLEERKLQREQALSELMPRLERALAAAEAAESCARAESAAARVLREQARDDRESTHAGYNKAAREAGAARRDREAAELERAIAASEREQVKGLHCDIEGLEGALMKAALVEAEVTFWRETLVHLLHAIRAQKRIFWDEADYLVYCSGPQPNELPPDRASFYCVPILHGVDKESVS